MSDNYAEETKPLFKMLRTEAFRFLIVRYNHYDLVRQLEHDLKQHFPNRPFLKIDTSKADYYSLTQTYFSINRGFLFLENFDDVLKEQLDSQGKETPQYKIDNERRRGITAGLNLRRDKLAKLPIALFVFVPASTGELYAKTIMEKMPDLWSFRSMILDLEKEITNPIALTTGIPLTVSDHKIEIFKEDTTELHRLLALLENTPAHEIAYRLTLYPQIVQEAQDTGNYEIAFSTLNAWENHVADTVKAWIWIQKGDILRIYGQLEEALAVLKKAKDLAERYADKNNTALSCERLGDIYAKLGDLDNALLLFEQYNTIVKEISANYPSEPMYKNALAISYGKLGETHGNLGNLDKALEFFEEYNRLEKELYAAYPYNVGFKHGLAASYDTLGSTHSSLGNLNKALEFFEKYIELSKELYASYPQNVDFKNALVFSYGKFGDTHYRLGNLDKAVHFFEQSNQLGQELYAAYPQNVNFKNGLALSYAKLGAVSRDELKDNKKAKAYFQEAEKLWIELVRDAPQYVQFQQFLEMVQKDIKSLD